MTGFGTGAEAFIVENASKVRPVRIISESGGLYTLMFRDGPGAVRLKKGRLYRTREDAESSIRRIKEPEVRGLRNPHTQGYYV